MVKLQSSRVALDLFFAVGGHETLPVRTPAYPADQSVFAPIERRRDARF